MNVIIYNDVNEINVFRMNWQFVSNLKSSQ